MIALPFASLCFWLLSLSADVGTADLVVVVASQQNKYHAEKAVRLKDAIIREAHQHSIAQPQVILLHDWTTKVGSWTILPILERLSTEFPGEGATFLFCGDEATIRLDRLQRRLLTYDFSQEIFLGRPLQDSDATIIHHFAFDKNSLLLYPDFASCFLLSAPLVKSLAVRLKSDPALTQFSIDAQYELADYIWNKGKGVRLTKAEFLCGFKASNDCAVFISTGLPTCGAPIGGDKVFFAVKTCEKYHEDRVPVVKRTWSGDARHIAYFSDKEDESIPTITLGVPNTERGHCGKSLAILRYAYDRLSATGFDWIIVVDDDSLMRCTGVTAEMFNADSDALDVSRLRKLLSCYDPEDKVALGERYGYALAHNGYDYITLGGGMALSRAALTALVESEECYCAADDAPDDMMLGMCFKRLGIPVTHSALFHQARPVDYSKGYLSNQSPVSFHRHWMINPYVVYNDWLSDSSDKHEEL